MGFYNYSPTLFIIVLELWFDLIVRATLYIEHLFLEI